MLLSKPAPGIPGQTRPVSWHLEKDTFPRALTLWEIRCCPRSSRGNVQDDDSVAMAKVGSEIALKLDVISPKMSEALLCVSKCV